MIVMSIYRRIILVKKMLAVYTHRLILWRLHPIIFIRE